MFPYELSLRQCWKKWIIYLHYPWFSLEVELPLVTAAADSILRLNQVQAAGYELRLILSCGWLEFQRLDRICGWFHHMVDSSSSGRIRVVADSILWLTWVPAAIYELQLISTCGWLRVAADSILLPTQDPPAGFDLRLTYTLIYSANLRTYSPECIIFIVCFLLDDFSYH